MNIFKSKSSDEIIEELTHKIILCALSYSVKNKQEDAMSSIDLGAEIIYFMLHLVDRNSFRFGTEKRDIIFDIISNKVLNDYTNIALKSDAPIEVLDELRIAMINKLDARQGIYGMCKEIITKDLPYRGTAIFALGYFTNAVMKKIRWNDEISYVLSGKKDITEENNDKFPDIIELIDLNVVIGNNIASLDLNKQLENLNKFIKLN